MVTRKQSIEQFRSRMDELIASNYILADKKITDVLKTVTASKLFYELISYCADGFDYEAEKAKAFGENGVRVLPARRIRFWQGGYFKNT